MKSIICCKFYRKSTVMDFIKSVCITEDANKCRFLIVDAYNTEEAIRFYFKNGFSFV